MRKIMFQGKSVISVGYLDERHFDHEDGWVSGYLVESGSGQNPFILGEVIEADSEDIVFEQWVPVHRDSVGQYTGQDDVDGKPIFEKDMVTYRERNLFQAFGGGDSDEPAYNTVTREIVWLDQGFNVPKGFVKDVRVTGTSFVEESAEYHSGEEEE